MEVEFGDKNLQHYNAITHFLILKKYNKNILHLLFPFCSFRPFSLMFITAQGKIESTLLIMGNIAKIATNLPFFPEISEKLVERNRERES